MAGRLDPAYVARLPAKIAAAKKFEHHIQNIQLAGIGHLALRRPGLFGAHYLNLEMQSFHVDMATKMRDKSIKRGLVLAPADHGKSTICSNLVPIMEIAEDRNIRIAIISAAATLSETLGRGILGHLAANQRLIENFGGFFSPNNKWTTTEAIVTGRDPKIRTQRDATLLLGGAGATWFGRRADLIICDDMITLDNAATPELRAKMRQWFFEAVVNMLEPDGRLWVVGTVQHHADLYAELKQKPEYTIIHYDSVLDEAEQKTLWPSKWPWDALMARKEEIGTIAFDKRYRNIARDESQMVFQEDWLTGETHPTRCYDFDHVIGEPDPSWVLAQFVDPAIGKSSASKYFAKIVVGWEKAARRLHVVDVVRKRLSQPEQEKLIVADHHRYGCVATIIEANAYQAGLAQGVQERAREEGFPITVLQHQTGKNKIEPMVGVLQLLPPLVENGMWKLPRGNPQSVRLTNLIKDELLPYPQGLTTDLVMTMWFAALYFAAPKSEAKVSTGNTIRGTYLGRQGGIWSR